MCSGGWWRLGSWISMNRMTSWIPFSGLKVLAQNEENLVGSQELPTNKPFNLHSLIFKSRNEFDYNKSPLIVKRPFKTSFGKGKIPRLNPPKKLSKKTSVKKLFLFLPKTQQQNKITIISLWTTKQSSIFTPYAPCWTERKKKFPKQKEEKYILI